MPDWIISTIGSLLGSAVLIGIAWGRFSARLERAEADNRALKSEIDKRVSREVFDLHQRNIETQLVEIKAMLRAIVERE